MVFVIDDIAYICGGENNNADVYDFWCFDPSQSTPWKQLRDIKDSSDDDYDDDYTSIVRCYGCAFVIDGKDISLWDKHPHRAFVLITGYMIRQRTCGMEKT